MSERIIFLDVDGVLNYMSYRNKSTANIDPSKVEMLAYICTQTICAPGLISPRITILPSTSIFCPERNVPR